MAGNDKDQGNDQKGERKEILDPLGNPTPKEWKEAWDAAVKEEEARDRWMAELMYEESRDQEVAHDKSQRKMNDLKDPCPAMIDELLTHPMETRYKRIILHPGTELEVLQWAQMINHYKEEAIQSLREEGVTQEVVYFFPGKKSEQPFLLYLLTAEDFDTTAKIAAGSERLVDKLHRKFKKECWGTSEMVDESTFKTLTKDHTPLVNLVIKG